MYGIYVSGILIQRLAAKIYLSPHRIEEINNSIGRFSSSGSLLQSYGKHLFHTFQFDFLFQYANLLGTFLHAAIAFFLIVVLIVRYRKGKRENIWFIGHAIVFLFFLAAYNAFTSIRFLSMSNDTWAMPDMPFAVEFILFSIIWIAVNPVLLGFNLVLIDRLAKKQPFDFDTVPGKVRKSFLPLVHYSMLCQTVTFVLFIIPSDIFSLNLYKHVLSAGHAVALMRALNYLHGFIYILIMMVPLFIVLQSRKMIESLKSTWELIKIYWPGLALLYVLGRAATFFTGTGVYYNVGYLSTGDTVFRPDFWIVLLVSAATRVFVIITFVLFFMKIAPKVLPEENPLS